MERFRNALKYGPYLRRCAATTRFTAVVLPDCVRANKPRTAPGIQEVVALPEPINAIVGSTVYIGIQVAQFLRISRLHLTLALILTLIGRVAFCRAFRCAALPMPPSTSAHFDLCLFTHGFPIIKHAQFASV